MECIDRAYIDKHAHRGAQLCIVRPGGFSTALLRHLTPSMQHGRQKQPKEHKLGDYGTNKRMATMDDQDNCRLYRDSLGMHLQTSYERSNGPTA